MENGIRKWFTIMMLLAAIAVISACGGGGGGNDENTSPSTGSGGTNSSKVTITVVKNFSSSNALFAFQDGATRYPYGTVEYLLFPGEDRVQTWSLNPGFQIYLENRNTHAFISGTSTLAAGTYRLGIYNDTNFPGQLKLMTY